MMSSSAFHVIHCFLLLALTRLCLQDCIHGVRIIFYLRVNFVIGVEQENMTFYRVLQTWGFETIVKHF